MSDHDQVNNINQYYKRWSLICLRDSHHDVERDIKVMIQTLVLLSHRGNEQHHPLVDDIMFKSSPRVHSFQELIQTMHCIAYHAN